MRVDERRRSRNGRKIVGERLRSCYDGMYQHEKAYAKNHRKKWRVMNREEFVTRLCKDLGVRKHMKLNVEPCTKVKERSFKEWFRKLNDECDELKDQLLYWNCLDDILHEFDYGNEKFDEKIIDEGCDVITVVVSMFTAMKVPPEVIQERMNKVIAHNIERGRMKEGRA